ncbi:MAG: tRNA pseudouridine(55) synthase TruB [Candidatus Paceibacterota bacterium]
MIKPIPQTKLPQPEELGVFLIDKPTGFSSHDVINQVRRLTGVRRVGHTGTLDPLATGLLIALIGREYTKLQTQFLKLDKEYLVTIQLGLTTDTYDITGKKSKQADWTEIQSISRKQLMSALRQFRGKISQTVPAFSAIKQAGKKLYDLALQGSINQDQLPVRQINIHHLKLKSFTKNNQTETAELVISLKVSSGTYVRSLAHDLGQTLGVGAIVTNLRRTKIGKYSVSKAVKLVMEKSSKIKSRN